MKIRSLLTAAIALAASVLGVALAAAPAAAQEFVKVDNATREQLPAPQFVGAAYAFIWLAFLGYVVLVARSLGRTRKEIDDLKHRVDRLNDVSADGGGVSVEPR
jgi:CcmD family protein